LQKSGRERSKNPGPMVPCCLSKILVLKWNLLLKMKYIHNKIHSSPS
jgi:hypothetical protein